MSDVEDDECPDLVTARVPVTIITGFLGSGKTTFLHYILSVEHHLKIAVIVNEFEFGKSIEKGLTVKSSAKSDDEWVELNNGCLCCAAKSQTVQALEALCHRKGTFDLVLVETSGMADPAPVCAMFWQDVALQGMLYLSGVVTFVDCKNIAKYLREKKDYKEATQQLLIADRIVFNKIDLVDENEKKGAMDAVMDLNPTVDPIFSSYSQISPEVLRKILFIDTTNTFGHIDPAHAPEGHSNITSAAIELGKEHGNGDPFLAIPTRKDVDFLCQQLLYHYGKECFEVVRSKAALWIGTHKKDVQLYQLQSIGEMFDVTPMAAVTVPVGVSRFLILGRELDEDRLEVIVKSFFRPVVE